MMAPVARVRWVLRITAAVALVQGLGHAALFIGARPRHGDAEITVIETMRARAFELGGFAPRSYWELYTGYGLIAIVFAFFVAAVLWLTSTLADEPRHVQRFTFAVLAAVAIHLGIVVRYFFPLPLEFDLAILAGTGVAGFANRGRASLRESAT